MSINLAFFGLQRDAVQPDARSPLPLPDAGARGGARPAPLRRPGAQGLHPADRRGRDGQDHAAPGAARAAGRHDRGRPSSPIRCCRFEGLLEYMLEDFGIAKPGESPRPAAHRAAELPDRAPARRPEHGADPRRGAESRRRRPSSRSGCSRTSRRQSEKILQILLVGQPELLDKLDLPELRQLKQRIGLRCSIPPLTRRADPRLHPDPAPDRRRAATSGSSPMRRSPGSPRTAAGSRASSTRLCDHCLLIGYADQIRRIDREIVEEAIEYLEEGERRPQRTRRPRHSRRRALVRWGRPAAGAALLAGTAA